VASRRWTNVAGVTGAFYLARPATVRRHSRSDDDTAGPNRAKTNREKLGAGSASAKEEVASAHQVAVAPSARGDRYKGQAARTKLGCRPIARAAAPARL